jgi:amidase
VHQTAGLLESLGHHVEVDFPSPLGDPQYRKRIAPLGSTMMSITLYRLGRILGREVTAADVEPVNWQRAMQARDLTAVDYAHALAARAQFRRAVHQWWAGWFDLLLTPTINAPPEPIDPAAPTVVDPKLQRSARTAVFTHPFNATGQPAISLPVHWTPDGLPVGVQLVAAYGNEATLIQVASQLEQAQPWATRHPSITASR